MKKFVFIILLLIVYSYCNGQATLVTDKQGDIADNSTAIPNFAAEVLNGEFTDENTFEFDVYINSLSGSFILTEYQIALSFNHNITSDLSDLTFSYIDGSSQLNNKPSHAIGINSGKLTFAVGSPLADTITTTNKRIGRFKLVNNGPFFAINPAIEWNFDIPVNTIIGKNGVDITQYGVFIKSSAQR